MEQFDEPDHECAACAPRQGEPEAPRTRWSRRTMLQLGVAAGVGAAALRGVAPAFGAPERSSVGSIEHESASPSAAAVQAALPHQVNFPVPPIVTRAEWGANESLRKSGQSYNSFVEKIVVHHTVTPNNPSDPAATVRSVYEYDVSGVYIDIAYHFLIDAHGRIYEGRWARDYPAGVAHTGENVLHQSVQGAATLAHNPNTIAVAMLGRSPTSCRPRRR